MKKEIKKFQAKKKAELRKIGRQRLVVFKKAKREQIQNVINAFNRFRIGCANVPGYSFHRMESIAAQLAALKADTKRAAVWGWE